MEVPNSIGRAELEVVHYVADHQPVGVREVALHMAEARGLARTSVLTVMERLREKKFLTRTKDDGRWMYSLAIAKERLLKGFVKDFVEHTLQGAITPFVAYLTDKTEVTPEQLDQLRSLLSDMEERVKRDRKSEK